MRFWWNGYWIINFKIIRILGLFVNCELSWRLYYKTRPSVRCVLSSIYKQFICLQANIKPSNPANFYLICFWRYQQVRVSWYTARSLSVYFNIVNQILWRFELRIFYKNLNVNETEKENIFIRSCWKTCVYIFLHTLQQLDGLWNSAAKVTLKSPSTSKLKFFAYFVVMDTTTSIVRKIFEIEWFYWLKTITWLQVALPSLYPFPIFPLFFFAFVYPS